MGEIKFSDNYNDLCRESGTDAGFQFEFYCEICNDTWRSRFVPYRAAQGAGWLNAASGVLGGVLGSAADIADNAVQAGFHKERDVRFAEAIEDAKAHFNRCPRCSQYVCERCWNADAGLCRACAPSAEVEIEAARASGAVYAVGEKAALEGIREGKKMDVKRRRQVVCPECGAPNEGARFCPECGARLAAESFCTECGAKLAAGAKFCGECGTKQADAG